MNYEEMKRRIEERARELWEADGRPEGCDMEYWIKAEEELAPHSVTGEEDPMEALDHDAPEVPEKGKVLLPAGEWQALARHP